ncbi:MAG: hypothetical protein ACOVNU_09905 [Candidatus Kapaibacteriota bacterium]
MSQLTAMEQLLNQMREERRDISMNIEWDKCYQAIESVIVNKYIPLEKEINTITEDTSDGYHTFKTLYEIRKAYNVALFNQWGKFDIPSFNVHKSRKHHDGEYPFGNNNWFIVCAELSSGQISNHYTMDNWELFKIPEYEKALFPFDGHTTDDVIDRLLKLNALWWI